MDQSVSTKTQYAQTPTGNGRGCEIEPAREASDPVAMHFGQSEYSGPSDFPRQKIFEAWSRCFDYLQQYKVGQTHWNGELSTSALSTATAISALTQYRNSMNRDNAERSSTSSPVRSVELADSAQLEKQTFSAADIDQAIHVGCDWLLQNQAQDGGFGDTDRSHSNVATSFLVVAAWKMVAGPTTHDTHASQQADLPCGVAEDSHFFDPVAKVRNYLLASGSWDALKARYGKDKTFVVPILSNCALAGIVPWSRVPQLPFEAAWLPQDLYRWARMPVVSYAIPALVAIGQARHHFSPTKNPVLRLLRNRAKLPTLNVLRRMQPASGGYLEATPLTSFVLMNLAAMGAHRLPVARDCVRFLLDSRLPDGSWPIDTNLATWLTSLSVSALANHPLANNRGTVAVGVSSIGDAHTKADGLRRDVESTSIDGETIGNRNAEAGSIEDLERDFWPGPEDLGPEDLGPENVKCDTSTLESIISLPVAAVTPEMVRWMLSCQHRNRHPFTGANPGGWGWTNLSGAVPDADDTPAALLALGKLDLESPKLMRLKHQTLVAAHGGLAWLLRLQNRNGGWPTFCRGWGKLPFDRSGTDLTAHALRAFNLWLPRLEDVNAAVDRSVTTGRSVSGSEDRLAISQLQASMRKGLRFLKKTQRSDGSWVPLWFGNQDRADEENPIYGTAKVLMAYAELGLADSLIAHRGVDFLMASQNEDGGWGGGQSTSYRAYRQDGSKTGLSSEIGSTIEETSLALEALTRCAGDSGNNATIMRGLDWLAEAIRCGHLDCSWPIGFYFAKLWYHERLYPAIFALSALGSLARRVLH